MPHASTTPIDPHEPTEAARVVSFWAMTATQFLGAFNDNLFKQLVLLLAVVSAAGGESVDRQSLAAGVFALPFILFSGFGGFLSDRISKRRIIVFCKMAEIVVMLLAATAFYSGASLELLLGVLFCMGMQSAFFGPAKYGVLPEMVRPRNLPPANGVIQMTTFVAIIFGTAGAGRLKEWLGDDLWIAGVMCVGVAIAGTITSLLIRPIPAAEPKLKFSPSALLIRRDTWSMLRGDRSLMGALLVSSLFWLVGGLILPAINALGMRVLEVGDARTSFLAAFLGGGIAVGCVVAGVISRGRVSFGMMRLGCAGVIIASGLIAITHADGSHWLGFDSSRWVLVALGASAGLFAVPLQVFLQARPPEGQKGRMIGAMNLLNWIAILLSAAVYQVCVVLAEQFSLSSTVTFAVAAVLFVPVLLFYRPKSDALA